MKKPSFTAVGDIGIDHFLSPDLKIPGGMALNSAFYAQHAGAQASVVSAVGIDPDGRMIVDFLTKNNILVSGLERLDGLTNTVEITLDADAKPQYGAWDLGILEKYRLSSTQKMYLKSQDIVITVHLPELRSMFDDVVACVLPQTLKVGDFTDLSEYQGDIGFLDQYAHSFDIFVVSIDEDVEKRTGLLQQFITRHNTFGIALLGSLGSRVFTDGQEYFHPAEEVPVIDTTGAGDTYLAHFLTSYIRDRDIEHAMKVGTRYASCTVQHMGAIDRATELG